jgi:undecaprenyl-diphosphatase
VIEAVRSRVAKLLAWRRTEPWVLELFLALGLLVWGFIEIGENVVQGETHRFDKALLEMLREPGDLDNPVGPWWFEAMVRDYTALGGAAVLALLTIFVLGYLLLAGKRANALLVIAAVVGGALLSHALKLGFDRPRPDLVARLVEVRTLSFPSGHAMLSAITYLTLGALVARVQGSARTRRYVMGIAVGLTLLVGASRVYLGVHWPSDVLAGWCGGAAWALVCWLLARRLERRGKVEPASPPPPTEPAT